MSNDKIINEFELLISELKNKSSDKSLPKSDITKINFKIKHFKNAVNIIKIFPKKITKGDDLKDISGIGKGIISRIDEIIKNKKLSEINRNEIKKITKKQDIIEELSKVINIGSKIAKQLIDEYDIKSVNDLKNKIKQNKIQVNDKIKMGLKYHGVFKDKIPRSEIDTYNNLLQNIIKKYDPNLIFIIAGSYRRQKSYSNDIDILLSHKKIKTDSEYSKSKINYLTEIINLFKKNKIIVDDLTDTDNGTKYMGFSKLPKKPVRRMDIRFVPNMYFHSALLYFTGSYELNTQMRQIAKNKGYKLNEYGLFKIKSDGTFSSKPLKANSEKDIFKKLDLDYLEPNQRG